MSEKTTVIVRACLLPQVDTSLTTKVLIMLLHLDIENINDTSTNFFEDMFLFCRNLYVQKAMCDTLGSMS